MFCHVSQCVISKFVKEMARDAEQDVMEVSSDALAALFKVNYKQCIDLLKSVYAAGVPPNLLQEAWKAAGQTGIPPKIDAVAPFPATNQTSETGSQILSSTLQQTWAAYDTAVGVSIPGVLIRQYFLWAGGFQGSFGEIQVGTNVSLPGFVSATAYPALQLQIVLGPGSQLTPGGLLTSNVMVGVYGTPSFITPPRPALNPQDLPPYTDNSWNDGNPVLFNPGQLTPFVDTSGASATENTSVMVRYTQDYQAKNSISMASNFSTSRIITLFTDLAITSNPTGTTATGVGTNAFVTDTRQPTFTSSYLQAVGGKNSSVNRKMLREGLTGGLSACLGVNVLQNLTPTSLQFITGTTLAGGAQAPTYSTTLFATGLSGILPLSTGYQCTSPPQSGALDGPFAQNGVYDRSTGVYAKVLWVSDRMTSSATFAQAPQLSPSACIVGVTPADFTQRVSNTYPQNVLSVDVVNTMSNVTNIPISILSENSLPVFTMQWNVTLGQNRATRLGHVCHVYMQILTNGAAKFVTRVIGLGTGGVPGGVEGSLTGASGVLTGGALNTYERSVAVDVAPGDEGSNNRQYSYVGSFIFLEGWADAMVKFDLWATAPREYMAGVIGPAIVSRVNGIGKEQQLVEESTAIFQVTMLPRARTLTSGKPSDVGHPMVNLGFPRLLEALFRSEMDQFFRMTLTFEEYMDRLRQLMALESPAQLAALVLGERNLLDRAVASYVAEKVGENRAILDRPARQLTADDVHDIARQEAQNAVSRAPMFGAGAPQAGGMFPQAGGMWGDDAEAGGMWPMAGGMWGDDDAEADGMWGDNANAAGPYTRKRPRAEAGGFFSDIWSGIKDVGGFVGGLAKDAVRTVESIGQAVLPGVAAALANPEILGAIATMHGIGEADASFFPGADAAGGYLDAANQLQLWKGTPNTLLGMSVPGKPWLGEVQAGFVLEALVAVGSGGFHYDYGTPIASSMTNAAFSLQSLMISAQQLLAAKHLNINVAVLNEFNRLMSAINADKTSGRRLFSQPDYRLLQVGKYQHPGQAEEGGDDEFAAFSKTFQEDRLHELYPFNYTLFFIVVNTAPRLQYIVCTNALARAILRVSNLDGFRKIWKAAMKPLDIDERVTLATYAVSPDGPDNVPRWRKFVANQGNETKTAILKLVKRAQKRQNTMINKMSRMALVDLEETGPVALMATVLATTFLAKFASRAAARGLTIPTYERPEWLTDEQVEQMKERKKSAGIYHGLDKWKTPGEGGRNPALKRGIEF